MKRRTTKIHIILSVLVAIGAVVTITPVVSGEDNAAFQQEKREERQVEQHIISPRMKAAMEARVAPRYFMSKIETINGELSPVLARYLVDGSGESLCDEWEVKYSAESIPNRVAFMRVKFRKNGVSVDPAGYIKELITKEDWRSVGNEYGFSQRRMDNKPPKRNENKKSR